MLRLLNFAAAFAALATAQVGIREPLVEECGPTTAKVVCINHYASVMPYHFYRNALSWEQFNEDSIRTMTINSSAWSRLITPADFLVFDRERGFEILGDAPSYEFIFNVTNDYHEAPVYVPSQNTLYFSRLRQSKLLPQYAVSLNTEPLTIEEVKLNPPLFAANDAQYVNGSIYWVVAGGSNATGYPPMEQRPGI